MAIFVRVLALAVLSTLASAVDQWGLFGCPANQRDKADDSVSYANPVTIAALSVRLLTGGPYTVIAAAENDEARRFSCITMAPSANIFTTTYYTDGLKTTATLTWDPIAAELMGRLPKGLLNTPYDNVDVKFTVTSYKDGFVVLKTCRSGIASNFVSTYVLLDKTVDKTALNMDCVIPTLNAKFGIDALPKGICV